MQVEQDQESNFEWIEVNEREFINKTKQNTTEKLKHLESNWNMENPCDVFQL